jgi:hypothetical protein
MTRFLRAASLVRVPANKFSASLSVDPLSAARDHAVRASKAQGPVRRRVRLEAHPDSARDDGPGRAAKAISTGAAFVVRIIDPAFFRCHHMSSVE